VFLFAFHLVADGWMGHGVAAQVEGAEVAGCIFGGGERGGSPGSCGLGFLGWNLAGAGFVIGCGGDGVIITGVKRAKYHVPSR
jgi:hypothetical protein